MRFNASVFIVAALAVNTPFLANAETLTSDGVVYSTGFEPAVYQSDEAPAFQGYGEVALIQETESVYASDGGLYQVIHETPVAYEDTSGLSYEATEAQMASDFAAQTVMTETIDGIVYETILSGETSVIEEMPILQTY